MNDTIINRDNLKADDLEVIQSLFTVLWMRLNKSLDPN